MFGSNKDFFVFLDSDIFVTRGDIRANLLQCRDHDLATGFRDIYELNELDTHRILNGDEGWGYRRDDYIPRGKTDMCEPGFITTKDGLKILAGRGRSASRERRSTNGSSHLRVYNSPNRARRLFGCASVTQKSVG